LKGRFLTLLTDLKMAGFDVNFILCDVSTENKALFDECRSQGYNLAFEFSGSQIIKKIERYNGKHKPSVPFYNVVRHNGMKKHSVPFYSDYIL
jgi:hypothetical protein